MARPRSQCNVSNEIVCKHCGRTLQHRAKGLCSTCFYKHGGQYPCLAPPKSWERKYKERFNGDGLSDDFNGEAAPCLEPTDARPGSDEKIEVLGRRFAAKQNLWHMRDNWQKILPANGDNVLDSPQEYD